MPRSRRKPPSQIELYQNAERLGLHGGDRDLFFAGAAVAFEILDEARDQAVTLSEEIDIIDAVCAELRRYAETKR